MRATHLVHQTTDVLLVNLVIVLGLHFSQALLLRGVLGRVSGLPLLLFLSQLFCGHSLALASIPKHDHARHDESKHDKGADKYRYDLSHADATVFVLFWLLLGPNLCN